jgi:MscS family membrane protein
MVDTIVDNISLRTERKFEMDMQLSVHTPATTISAFTDHLRNFIKQQAGVVNTIVILTDAGKQAHIIHAEVFVSMHVDISAFQTLREKINIEAIQYANQHQIAFAEL